MVVDVTRDSFRSAECLMRLLSVPMVALFAAPVVATEATLVIDNARVVVGDGRVIDRATIVIRQDRIDQVIPGNERVDAARHIDCANRKRATR